MLRFFSSEHLHSTGSLKQLLNPSFFIFLTCFLLLSPLSASFSESPASDIQRVRLYPGKAEITRVQTLSLQKGSNRITITHLPRGVMDWSVRGELTGNFQGKIVSLKVESVALLEKYQKRVRELETRLDQLHDRDRIHLDQIAALNEEMDFLHAFRDRNGRDHSAPVLNGKTNLATLENSMKFSSSRTERILTEKRLTEIKRREIGKEIQKLEYELRKETGEDYFRSFMNLSEERRKKGGALNEQTFGKLQQDYMVNRSFRVAPGSGPDTEKQIILEIDSPVTGKFPFLFSYLIQDGDWKMNYDLRAMPMDDLVNLTVYGDIRQTTGEDWKEVELILSTGSPSTSLQDFSMRPLYLDTYSGNINELKEKGLRMRQEQAMVQQSLPNAELPAGYRDTDDRSVESGLYMEYRYPVKVNIPSTSDYQRRRLKEIALKGGEFRYELYPETSPSALLKYIMQNPGPESWINGEARLFYESQFTGRTSLPLILPDAKEKVLIAQEDRLTGKKVLVKKFKDRAGVFGNTERISYTYRILLDNHTGKEIAFFLYDRLPVSRNEKVTVEIKLPQGYPVEDPDYRKEANREKGFRRYRLSLGPGEKRQLQYELIVTHPSDVTIPNLP